MQFKLLALYSLVNFVEFFFINKICFRYDTKKNDQKCD